jgi:VWFA-related protein
VNVTTSRARIARWTPIILGTAAALGQDLEFAEPLEVRLVEVEVFVSDGRGRPVLDLNQSDLELRVDGERQNISSFAAPSVLTVEKAPRSQSQPGRLVLFFDNNNIESLQRNAFIEEIKRFLTERPQLDHPVMIASTSPTEFRVHHDFTVDPEEIRASLDAVSQSLAQDQRIAEYQAIFRELQRLSSAVQDFSGRGIAPQAQSLMGRIQIFSDQSRDDALRSAGYVWRLTDSLSGLPGRCAIVYVGGVFSLTPGATLYAALRDVLSSRTGPEAQETSARLPAGISTDGAQSLEALADHVSSNGIGFYALTEPGRRDALGGGVSVGSMESAAGDAPDPQDVWSPGVAFRSRSEARESVEILAAATGGLADTGARRVGPTIKKIYADLESFYLIAFQPDHDLDGQSHRISVTVDRKNVRVRHRSSYRALSWDQESANLIRSTLHFGGELNPLQIRIDRGQPVELDPGISRIPLSVQIPLSKLSVVSAGANHRGQVTLFYAAGSSTLAAEPIRKIVLPIAISNTDLLEAIGQSLDYRIDVDLPAGSDRLIVGVRDDLDDSLSTRRILLDQGGS